jgi:hypothetical protein
MHKDLAAASDLTCDADGETIGVRRRQRELPVAHGEPALEFLTEPNRVFGGEHQGNSPPQLLDDGA